MPRYEDRASSKYLTHKYASFHGCTLSEMGVILGLYAAVELPMILILSVFLSPYLGGYLGSLLLLFLLFAMPTFFVFVRKTAERIGKLRKGKSAGYLKLRTFQLLNEKLGLTIPFINRCGRWCTQRSIKRV